jgi:hypothetical protein
MDTRFVNWEINLTHDPPNKRELFTLEYIYFGPNGEVFGRNQLDTYIEKGWDYSYHSIGFGYSEMGNWQSGRYRVEVYLHGKKLAEGHFTIVKDSVDFIDTVTVDSVFFFESGYESIKKEERDYRQQFAPDARYIDWEVNLSYPKVKVRKKVKFEYIYYKEDGSVFGTSNFESDLEDGWEKSWHSSGYGFKDQGNWPLGQYLVEINLNGKIIAKKHFEIVQPAPSHTDKGSKKWFQFWK